MTGEPSTDATDEDGPGDPMGGNPPAGTAGERSTEATAGVDSGGPMGGDRSAGGGEPAGPGGGRRVGGENGGGPGGPGGPGGDEASAAGSRPLGMVTGDGRLGRRALLVGAGVVAAGLGLRLVVGAATDDDGGDEGGDGPAIAEAELAAVRRVGEAYLAVRPDEANAAALEGALAPEVRRALEAAPAGGPLPPAALAAIRADHGEGRVVEVDGWRLAETAGRLAALVHLSG